jgi:hypothetical protein
VLAWGEGPGAWCCILTSMVPLAHPDLQTRRVFSSVYCSCRRAVIIRPWDAARAVLHI